MSRALTASWPCAECRVRRAEHGKNRKACEKYVLQFGRNCDPHEHQRRAIGSRAQYVVIAAGTGGGKTYASTWAALCRIFADLARYTAEGRRWEPLAGVPLTNQDPFLLYWFVGPTYRLSKRLERQTIACLRPVWDEVVVHRVNREIWLRGGICIEFKSGDNPDGLVADSVDGVVVTEAARLNPETWQGALFSRLRGHTWHRPGWAILDSTPKGRNWFYSQAWERTLKGSATYDPENWAGFRWLTTDNTKSPGVVEHARQAKATLPPRYYRRDYEASFEAFEGQVFDEFDRCVHVVAHDALPPREAFVEVGAGQDWGYRNPGALVIVAKDGDGHLYVIDEVVERGLHVVSPSTGGDSWVERARAKCAEWGLAWIAAGPDRPSDIDAYAAGGIPAEAANNAVADGIRDIALRLHHGDGVRPRVFFSDRCEKTLRSIESYRYKTAREGHAESEEPLKVDDHEADALRYCVRRFDLGDPTLMLYTQRQDSPRRVAINGPNRRQSRRWR